MDDGDTRIARLQPGEFVEGDRTFPGGSHGVWRSRGYIPHFESGGAIQHVTFRLADSLPKEALERIEWELDQQEKSTRQAGAWRSQERRRRIEELMDAGHGSCLLRDPQFAKPVQDALQHFDGVRYRLFAWVIMPNHVHVLFEPIAPWTMSKIVSSWKSFTARKIADTLRSRNGSAMGSPGSSLASSERIWFREYWDRFVRNERHFRAAVDYIHNNPVKAGLVARPEDWEWSSASARR